MIRIKRNRVLKEQAKSIVEFYSYDSKHSKLAYKEQYVYRAGNTYDIEKIKKYADTYNYDVLDFIHLVKLTPVQWQHYYNGGYVTLNSNSIYEYERLFIDIDLSLAEHYGKLRKALQNIGINNYQVYESAGGNIHLYIQVKKFSDKVRYKNIVKLVGWYLLSEGLEIDDSSAKELQKTFLEGFRVAKKNGFTSRKIKELCSTGEAQTVFDIERIMHSKGFKRGKTYSMKYAMYIIKKEVFTTYTGTLHLRQLEREYLVPHSTISRALQRLSEAGAIEYRVHSGHKGHIQIQKLQENNFDLCIERQLTRSQNYIYVNVVYALSLLFFISRNSFFKIFFQWCNYIKKNVKGFQVYLILFVVMFRTGGILSGGSGVTSLDFEQNKGLVPIPNFIHQGQRNTILWRTLIQAKAKGLNAGDISRLATSIHSRMAQPSGDIYGVSQVQSVVKWVHKLEFSNASHRASNIL